MVEMLISMAVTLVMMAAVVNLFANIGAGVRNRRASMELGGQLRMARARLFKDLAGATSAARPKLPSDDHDDGYLEIIEGQYSDKNPSALVLSGNIDEVDGSGVPLGLQHQTSLVPRDNAGRLVQWVDDNNNGIVDSTAERNSVRSSGSALGDYDDILALTVRSESEPFVGRSVVWDGSAWVEKSIESDLAEVIWFSVENPADGSLGEPGLRNVYRRVLLIAPWVAELPPYVDTAFPTKAIDLDQICYQLSDVSFRREGNVRVPNTLSDLTKRENRFAHDRNYPHALDLVGIRNNNATTRNNFPEFTGAQRTVLHPFGLPFEWDRASSFTLQDDNASIPTDPPGELSVGADRKGEDIMLNDVLAFDLRVFDSGAPLYNSSGIILEPNDQAWLNAYLNQEFVTPEFDAMIGQGSYVDMGYIEAAGVAAIPPNSNTGPQPTRPMFDKVPSPKSQLNFAPAANPIKFVVYDTWPYHYETDGINQDGDSFGANPLIDEGTDGLDNDGNNGVDDSIERETAPPYDHPLRAMQAKIRVYDRESRQIREATVTRNFVPQ